MDDKIYYVKKGRKYVSVGRFLPVDSMPDGIWLVQSQPGSRTYSQIVGLIDYKFDQFPHINTYAEQTELKEAVVSVFADLRDKNEFIAYNQSMYDLADKVCKEIYKIVRKNKKSRGRNG